MCVLARSATRSWPAVKFASGGGSAGASFSQACSPGEGEEAGEGWGTAGLGVRRASGSV